MKDVPPRLLLCAKRPAGVTADHDWVGQPPHSSRQHQRYQCSLCGAWGWRAFPSKAARARGAVLLPVRPYTVEGKGKTRVLRFDPDPIWSQLGGDPDIERRDERIAYRQACGPESATPEPHSPPRRLRAR